MVQIVLVHIEDNPHSSFETKPGNNLDDNTSTIL